MAYEEYMDYVEYMKPFEEWLTAQGLSRKTIRRTLNRAESFLDYLAYHSDPDAENEVPVTNEVLLKIELSKTLKSLER